MASEIRALVDSVRKHANFKRLAAYSLQSLCKKCTPPSNGWQENARDAFDAGAPSAIQDVLLQHSKDSEIFLHALTALQAMAAVGRGSGLLANATVDAVIKAFKEYAAAAELPSADAALANGLIVNGVYSASGPDAEAVAVCESFLRLLVYIVTQARTEAATSATVVPCLLSLLPSLPTPNSVRLAFSALEGLSRCDAGLDALADAATAITPLMAGASRVFGLQLMQAAQTSAGGAGGPPSPSASDRAARVQAQRRTGSGGAGAATGSAAVLQAAGGIGRINGHLEPAFRLLDRLSRNDAGLRSLRETKAVSQLAASVEFAQMGCEPHVGALGVRVIARVLGSELKALLDKIAAAGSGETSFLEAEFAASLLASLALDADIAGKLVQAGLCGPLLQLLEVNDGKGCSAKAAASLCQAAKRIASHSDDNLDAMLEANAVARIMKTVRASEGQARVLTEGLSALSDMICSAADVATADAVPAPASATGSSSPSAIFYVLSLLKSNGAADAALACAYLQFLHACQCQGFDNAALVREGVVAAALGAMTSPTSKAEGHIELQLHGTLVLTSCADEQAHVDAIVSGGGIAVAVGNLSLRPTLSAGAGGGGMGSARLLSASASHVGRASLATAGGMAGNAFSRVRTRSMERDDTADGAAAAASGASAGSLAVLVAATLHFLTVLCKKPEHIATAKSHGVVRAMLTAYTRHSSNDAVHDAFVDLVEGIVSESEVVEAIRAVARSVTLIKEGYGDPVMFAIAEADLGKEGVMAEDGSITAADESGTDGGAGAGAGTGKSPKTKAGKKGGAGTKESVNSAAVRLTEDLCLLEAVCNSARLSGVLVRSSGVPVLVRTIGLLCAVKGRPDAMDGGKGFGGKGRAVVLQQAGGRDDELEKSLSESLQEEALMRATNTLTGLARINIDSRNGVPGLDPIPTSITNATLTTTSPTAAGRRMDAMFLGVGSPRMGGGGGGMTGGRAAAFGAIVGHRRQRSGKTVGNELLRIQQDIGQWLFRTIVIKTLVRAINARSNLRAVVSAISVALGVLSLGSKGAQVQPLDSIISHSGVEAVVSGMRAHSSASALPVLLSVSNGLGCIAICGRAVDDATGKLRMPAPAETNGSAAVVTRGATRQIIRELQNAAAAANGSGARWSGPLGQSVLCSLLRVLLVVAETSKGAELLKKQALVDALVATMDAGQGGGGEGGSETAGGGAGAGSGGARGGAGGESGGKEDEKGSAVASALAGDAFAGMMAGGEGGSRASAAAAAALDGVLDGGSGGLLSFHSPDAQALMIAILSKLMDMKDLLEAIKLIAATAEKAAAGSLKGASITLCSVALTTVLALANTENGKKAGGDVWAQALQACVDLITAVNNASSSITESAGEPDRAKLASAAAAATALLPGACRCVEAITRFREAFGDAVHGAGGALSGRWSSSAATGAHAMITLLQLGKGVRMSRSSLTPTAKAAAEKIGNSYAAALRDALHTLVTLHREDAVARSLLTAVETGPADRNPLSGLMRTVSRFVDDGDTDALEVAMELLLSISKARSESGKLDGLSALAAVDPEALPIINRAVTELLSANGSPRAVGAAMLLLGRMCKKSPAMAVTVRAAGGLDLQRSALQRYCGANAAADATGGAGGSSGSGAAGNGAARVLEGAALLTSALIGHGPAVVLAAATAASGGDPSGSPTADVEMTVQEDLTAVVRIINTVATDATGGYASTCKAMIAVSEMVVTACTAADDSSAAAATAAASATGEGGAEQPHSSKAIMTTAAADLIRQTLVEINTRDIIVTAMSSPSADSRLLRIGAKALAALGGGDAGGLATLARRAIAAARRVCKLRPVPGLLPDGTAGLAVADTPASVSSVPLTERAAQGSSSGAGGTGPNSDKDKAGSAYEAMQDVDAAMRNLAAALAGETSVTPVTFRFLFDTLAAAVETANAAQRLAAAGQLAATTDAASAGGMGAAAVLSPSSRASMRPDGVGRRSLSFASPLATTAPAAAAAASSEGSAAAAAATSGSATGGLTPVSSAAAAAQRRSMSRSRGASFLASATVTAATGGSGSGTGITPGTGRSRGASMASRSMMAAAELDGDGAADGGFGSLSAGMGALLSVCAGIVSTSVQGVARLAAAAVVRNARAGEVPTTIETAASTGSATAAADPFRVFDASMEERGKYGDPRGTASMARVHDLHDAAAAGLRATGTPVGSNTHSSHPVFAPVSAAEIVDVLLTAVSRGPVALESIALTQAGAHRFEGSMASVASAMRPASTLSAAAAAAGPASMRSGVASVGGGMGGAEAAVPADVSDSIAKSIQDLCNTAAAAGPAAVGFIRVDGPAATSGDDGASSMTMTVTAAVELVWAAAARGLLHTLAAAVLRAAGEGQSAVLGGAQPAPTTPAPATGGSSPGAASGKMSARATPAAAASAVTVTVTAAASLACPASVFTAPAFMPSSIPRIRDALCSLLQLASTAGVVRYLQAVLTGSNEDAHAALLASASPMSLPRDMSAAAAAVTTPGSMAKPDTPVAASVRSSTMTFSPGPQPLGARSGPGSWSCLAPAAGNVMATPATVVLQLLLTAEAVSRPSTEQLVRMAADGLLGGEEQGDGFEAAFASLQRMSTSKDLRHLAAALVSTQPARPGSSPAWALLAQIMDAGALGGLTQLLPPCVTPLHHRLYRSLPVTSLGYMRTMAELFDALHLSVLSSVGGDGSSSAQGRELIFDAASVPVTVVTVASLFSAWAKAVVSVMDPKDEPPTPMGEQALAEAASVEQEAAAAAASDAAAAAAEGGAPGSPLHIKPDLHVEVEGEEEEDKEDGEAADQHTELVPVSAARSSVRSGGGAALARVPSAFSASAPAAPAPGTTPSAAAAEAAKVAALAQRAAYAAFCKTVVHAAVRITGHAKLTAPEGAVAAAPTPTPGRMPMPARAASTPGSRTGASTGATPTAAAAAAAVAAPMMQTPSGIAAVTLQLLVTDPATMSLYRTTLRQSGCDMLATAGVQVLRRVIGLGPSPVTPATAAACSASRIEALSSEGVLLRVLLAMGLHASSSLYVQEALRLLDDVGTLSALTAAEPADMYTGSMLVSLGLTEDCLKTLQSAQKRLMAEGGDEGSIARAGRLITALSEVFTTLSSKGFLDALSRALDAAEACRYVKRTISGEVVYVEKPRSSGSSGDAPTSPSKGSGGARDKALKEAPESFTAMMSCMEDLLAVCLNLEADAVPQVPPPLLKRVPDALKSFLLDVKVVGVLTLAMARACDNGINQPEILKTKLVTSVVSLVKYHKEDVFAAEAMASFFRPLTVRLDNIRRLLDAGVVPAVANLLDQHINTLQLTKKRAGQDGAGGGKESAEAKAAREAAEKALLAKLTSPDAAKAAAAASSFTHADPFVAAAGLAPPDTAPTDPAFEPRIAHYCVQCLANIACDTAEEADLSGVEGITDAAQHITEGCSGGVARIIAAHGVDALQACMAAHLERPRILEDALCAMSNIAYSCDGARLLIGRSAAGLIVQVLRVFNGDAYLFSMALRAVGNLTRCDENIIAVVADGVIEGIVEGMQKNADNAEVLRLSADVIGNLASIEESAVDRKEGLRILKQGMKRRTNKSGNGALLSNYGSSASSKGRGAGSNGGNEPIGASSTARDMVARAKAADMSLQDAVSRWLVDDGAGHGLTAAMLAHASNADVVSACLRSLQYMCETQALTERLQSSVDLAAATCRVMRSLDFDPELCLRGSVLLGQMMQWHTSPARSAAIEAGAPSVILSAVETHDRNVEVFTALLRTLSSGCHMEPATLSAARELGSVPVLTGIMTEASKGLVAAGGITALVRKTPAAKKGKAAGGAGAGGAGAGAAAASEDGADAGEEDSGLRSGVKINTLSTATGEESLVVFRHMLHMLTPWTGDATLAEQMAGPATAAVVATCGPGPATSFPDLPLTEMSFGLLSGLVAAGATLIPAMVGAGLLTLFPQFPRSVPHLDRAPLIELALGVLDAVAAASSPMALAALEANAHGVCVGIAAHWALKRTVPEAERRPVYERAGRTLAALTEAAIPARVEKALMEASAAAVATAVTGTAAVVDMVSGGAGPTGAPAPAPAAAAAVQADGIDGMSKAQMRARRQQSLAQTPTSRTADEKQKAKAEAARLKEATKLAKAYTKRDGSAAASAGGGSSAMTGNGYQATDLLEMRAGLMPWSLFPRDAIDAMAMTDVVSCDVWFLPDMHPNAKVKVRSMRLTLSPDLRLLTWAYQSKHQGRMVDWNLPLSSSTVVRAGVPTGKARRRLFFLRNPDVARSIALENDAHTLLHLEATTAEQHDTLLRSLSVLCQYARARDGVMEPLPDLPAAAMQQVAANVAANVAAQQPAAVMPVAAPADAATAVPTITVPQYGPPGAVMTTTAVGDEPLLKLPTPIPAPTAAAASPVVPAAGGAGADAAAIAAKLSTPGRGATQSDAGSSTAAAPQSASGAGSPLPPAINAVKDW